MSDFKFMLYIFAGLPGTGKTTLSSALSSMLDAVYLRVDTIEQAMKDAGVSDVGAKGYMVSYAIASENLKLGLKVVADTVNPIELTRRAWRDTALKENKHFIEIEVICSDIEEHQQRVEERKMSVPGLNPPTWEKVLEREYEPWETDRIIMDTAGQSKEQSLSRLCKALGIDELVDSA